MRRIYIETGMTTIAVVELPKETTRVSIHPTNKNLLLYNDDYGFDGMDCVELEKGQWQVLCSMANLKSHHFKTDLFPWTNEYQGNNSIISGYRYGNQICGSTREAMMVALEANGIWFQSSRQVDEVIAKSDELKKLLENKVWENPYILKKI